MQTKPIPRGEFNDAQNALMRRGNPEDPCGRCGCRRKHHLPTPTFAYYNVTPVLVPTCCDCPFCFCDCVGFVEPFAGQRFAQCVYEPRPKPAALAPASGQYEYLDDTSHFPPSIEGAKQEVADPQPAPMAAKPRRKKQQPIADQQPRLFA